MDDQKINQINGLSYEEELDVLEAVYQIGKEKGLELLRPDQMKKLVDGGRTNKGKVEKEVITPLNNKQRNSVKNFYIAKEVTTELRASIVKDFPALFESDEVGSVERDDAFAAVYGTSPQFFAVDLFDRLNAQRRSSNGQ